MQTRDIADYLMTVRVDAEPGVKNGVLAGERRAY
jgi:hypothetical protein